jgi:hypothetical protein
MYQGIYNDYKARGFQMLAVAFNEPLNAHMAAQFSQQFGISFPLA